MDGIDSERTKVPKAYRDPRSTFLSFLPFFFLLSYSYFVPRTSCPLNNQLTALCSTNKYKILSLTWIIEGNHLEQARIKQKRFSQSSLMICHFSLTFNIKSVCNINLCNFCNYASIFVTINS